LADLADGEVVLGRIDLYPEPVASKVISLRPERTNAILGTSLANTQIADSLKRLGLQVTDSAKSFVVAVPTFRPDLVKEIDLIEEVGRIIGYETLPETLPKAPGFGACDSPSGIFAAKARDILSGLGLREVATHTLAAPSPFDAPENAGKRVAIRSALSAELSGLRQSIVPNILAAAARNMRHKVEDIRIFEIGKTFQLGDKAGVYNETQLLAGVLTGIEKPYGWNAGETRPVDYFTAKGALETLFLKLGLPAAVFKPHVVHGMHPGRSAMVEINGHAVGYVAEVDPDFVKRDMDAPASAGRIAVFEVDAGMLMNMSSDERRYQPLPRHPAVNRDLAVVIDRRALYGDIERVAREAVDQTLMEGISLLSVYTGDRVASDKKSVAIRFTFRASDRTLTDVEVDAQLLAAQNALADSLGAERR
jgi:phenylalanyl-tRNA synthetase beta chain